MSQLFETMVNLGPGPFFKRLDAFLKTKGKSINDYTDANTMRNSNIDTLYVYSDIKEVDGFEKFIDTCNLVDTGKDSAEPFARETIILSPKNNNIMWDSKSEQFFNFSDRFKRSKLYHLSLPNLRNSIIINGLRPKSNKFISDGDGTETYDGRIYFIVSGYVDFMRKTRIKYLTVEHAIKSLEKDMSEKRKYSGKYDIWEVTLPDGVELHRDPKFLVGGFVTCTIPPKFIRLIDENDLHLEH